MDKTFPIVISLLLLGLAGWAQPSLLDRKVSVSASNERLEDVLFHIGEQGQFSFSYNASLFPADTVISLQLDHQPVKAILDTIFRHRMEYKINGRHLILVGKPKEEPSKKYRYQVSGYVINRATGEKLPKASIYVMDQTVSAITDGSGYYKINLTSEQAYLGLAISKSDFLDTVIIIEPLQEGNINVNLSPIGSLEKLPLKPATITNPYPVDDLPAVKLFVSQNQKTQVLNRTILQQKPAQISLVPGIGTNRMMSGLVVNNLSINVLIGYSGGLKGLEMGGLMNIVRGDVHGVQLSGFSNITGGETKGLQAAGFFNNNRGSVKGVQLAGFNNIVLDTVKGVQAAGFNNIVRGRVDGLMISGFNNIATKDMDGFQAAGFSNIAGGDVNKLQVSGFFNYGRNMNGAQVAGFANVANGKLYGLQMAGFLNVAKEIDGFQLGFINISDTVSYGTAFGFLSFVRKGYHKFELDANASRAGLLYFKTGTSRFYNILAGGFKLDSIWLYGYGLGTEFSLGKHLLINTDWITYQVNEKKISDGLNLWSEIRMNLGIKTSKTTAIVLGPTVNVQVTQLFNADTGQWGSGISNNPFFNETYGSDVNVQMWVGANLGFRF